MIDHIGIEVSDISVARRFYTKALAPLGITPLMEYEGSVGFGSDLGKGPRPYLWLNERGREPVRGAHIALRARTLEQVHEFHAAALAAGGTDNGAPGPRPHYHASYYAAFVLDPDGNNVEAVSYAYSEE